MTPDIENQLIALLPRAARQRFVALCTTEPLMLGTVLNEAGAPLLRVHFPLDGFVSLLAEVDGAHSLEVGMVGREGMVGVPAALGQASAPLQALVQGEGRARCMAVPVFRQALAGSTALQQVMHRYVGVLMTQLATAAACQRYHEIGPRLARWLLMCQDRAHADRFPVTQAFLSNMLGVRRVGVTAAAGALQHAGLIHYHRGMVTVADRTGLEGMACSCYASDRRHYALVIPGLP